MGTKRKQHSAEFKAQVAMAALAGDKTVAKLASERAGHQQRAALGMPARGKPGKSVGAHSA